ncbi:MAG: DUF885 domain-containing protein [Colwellia sp.]|nr:DUF885 domain-containing protein [Colwellia sp.]
MRKFATVLTLTAIGILTACQPTEQNSTTSVSEKAVEQVQTSSAIQSESERLNHWFADKYEEQLQMSPMMLTFLGRKDQYDKIDDMSEAEEQRQLAWQAAAAKELKASFDYQKLNDESKTSYDLWLYQYQEAVDNDKFTEYGYVFTQMQGIQSFAAQFLMSFHKVDEESDMVAYNTRIIGVAKAISVLLERAKKRAENGIRPPKFAYQGVIEQASALINGVPFTTSDEETDSALWADANKKVASLLKDKKIDQKKADELLATSKKALLEHFLPSYQALVAWFEADIVNTQDNASGVGGLPNGKAYYNARLKASTTTDLSAEEIHQTGLNEVARITQEMEAIKDRVGFEGSLKEFFTFIKTDKQFFFANDDSGRQGYITETEEYLAQITEQLPNFFGILPKSALVVKRVESYREQDGAAQHYFAGTPDGSRPGVYYAHLSDMSTMPKNEMEGVAYHEGSPGHHMQISIAQELTSVPQFRTQANFTAYAEGWGLYAELLAKEMGGYQNDFSDFGRLVNEIWRAVRLVVDSGLHAKGWTEQEAIAYFKEKAPVSSEAIQSEIRRYLVIPGQATAYKIGMLKIISLRALAEKELAEKFDIKGFHDTILSGGAMPLGLLERRVNTWITKVKST